ncbi:MAG: hypothetical protein D4R57_00285 [Verrucomicrobiales bacterium]|nr:MAG: hypothetical protein D4R57_00285 [Verrucomicrobiales bacterium]
MLVSVTAPNSRTSRADEDSLRCIARSFLESGNYGPKEIRAKADKGAATGCDQGPARNPASKSGYTFSFQECVVA